jgi:hypothetical protein
LAEHLYDATQTLELTENTKAAESLLNKHPEADSDFIELVTAFKSLKGGTSGLEVVCDKVNLANVRLVAEATRAGANLGSKKSSEPLRRLSVVIVELIAYARSVCPAHLDGKWPKLWSPNFTYDDMKYHIESLGINADSLLRQDERSNWGKLLSRALQEDVSHDLYVGRNIEPECKDPIFTTKKDILAHQLREYVYKPCREFVEFREARDVLEPYGDLLMSWHAIDEYLNTRELASIDRYYDNKNYNRRIRQLVYAYGACRRVLVMPEKDVVNQVLKSRKHDH